MRVRGGSVRSGPRHVTTDIPTDVQPLESNFLIPNGTLIVLLVLLMMLVVFAVLFAWLLRFLIARRDTAPQGQTGNDPSRR
jgi:hypothetical protein